MSIALQVTNSQHCFFCSADGSDTSQYLSVSKPKHKDVFSAKEKFIHAKVFTTFTTAYIPLFFSNVWGVKNQIISMRRMIAQI
jgi:hypothetical protein